MSLTFGFYDSVNHDRVYSSKDFSAIFDGIINDGVFQSVGNHFSVTPGTGMVVNIGSGRAWFRSTWTYNSSPYSLEIQQSELTLTRLDTVVLEIDKSNSIRRNTFKIVVGLPGVTPRQGTLINNDSVLQIPIAHITVNPGVSAIVASNIEQCVGTSVCPFITGILQTASLDSLYSNWEDQFNTWFDGVKGVLSGDATGTLLNMVNERVKYSDKATAQEISEGTNDTHYVTPARVKDAISYDTLFNVGDILHTTQASIGPKWALCNGDPVIGHDTFANLIIPGFIRTGSQCTLGKVTETGDNTIYTVKKLGEYYVFFSANARILYSKNIEGPYESAVVCSTDTSASIIDAVFDAEGRYTFLLQKGDTSNVYLYLSSTNSLSSVFMQQALVSNSSARRFFRMVYDDAHYKYHIIGYDVSNYPFNGNIAVSGGYIHPCTRCELEMIFSDPTVANLSETFVSTVIYKYYTPDTGVTVPPEYPPVGADYTPAMFYLNKKLLKRCGEGFKYSSDGGSTWITVAKNIYGGFYNKNTGTYLLIGDAVPNQTNACYIYSGESLSSLTESTLQYPKLSDFEFSNRVWASTEWGKYLVIGNTGSYNSSGNYTIADRVFVYDCENKVFANVFDPVLSMTSPFRNALFFKDRNLYVFQTKPTKTGGSSSTGYTYTTDREILKFSFINFPYISPNNSRAFIKIEA